MDSSNQLSYVIRQGDNLYQLAGHYRTTVSEILSLNPNIDPYNLQVGTSIIVNPGEKFGKQESNSNSTVCTDCSSKIDLINNMRVAWIQHVYWTRMLLISIAERLADQSDVTKRLLQNPFDIANVFGNYYPEEIVARIAQLLTEHLQIGADLITALRDGKTEEANDLKGQWYINADKMADAFSSINPNYDYEEVQKMLYTHLELTTQEVAMRLARNYPADIESFNEVEREVLTMADYFSAGLI